MTRSSPILQWGSVASSRCSCCLCLHHRRCGCDSGILHAEGRGPH